MRELHADTWCVGDVDMLQDLEGKIVVDELKPEVMGSTTKAPVCLSLAWSSDGQTLFAGYTDKLIRVWQVSMVSR